MKYTSSSGRGIAEAIAAHVKPNYWHVLSEDVIQEVRIG